MNLLHVVRGLLPPGREGVGMAQLKVVTGVEIKGFICIPKYTEKL